MLTQSSEPTKHQGCEFAIIAKSSETKTDSNPPNNMAKNKGRKIEDDINNDEDEDEEEVETTPTKKKGNAAAGAKTAEKPPVVANTKLVEALRTFDRSKDETKSYLIDVATIVQEEQLTRAEVVASMIEARGVSKATAESQYSRMKKIFTDGETLEALRSGEIDLKTAREKSVKKQENPSATKKEENLEKRYAGALTKLLEAVKEMGTDLASFLASVKASAKKAGIR